MVSYNRKFADRAILLLRSPFFTTFVCKDKDDIFDKVKRGDYEAVHHYLKSGGDPNVLGHMHLKATRSEGFSMQWSLLFEAASLNNVAVFILIAQAVGLHNVDHMSTSLWLACRYGYIDTVKWLLCNTNASIHGCQQCSYNSALNASENGHINVTRYIVENCELDMNSTNNNWSESLLHLVITRERFDGRTPLHDAVEIDEIEEVYLILCKGYYIDVQDNTGVTPLHIACEYGRTDILHVLYSASANTKLKNNFGLSTLDIAVRMNHPSIIEFIADDWGITQQQVSFSINCSSVCSNQDAINLTRNIDKLTTNTAYHKNVESDTFDISNTGNSYLSPTEFGFYLKSSLCSIKLGRELVKSNVTVFINFALENVKNQLLLSLSKKTNDNSLRYTQKKLTRALQIFSEIFAKSENVNDHELGKNKKKIHHVKVHFINSDPPEIYFFPVIDNGNDSSTISLDRILSFLPFSSSCASKRKSNILNDESNNNGNDHYISTEYLFLTDQMNKLIEYVNKSVTNYTAASVIASVLDNDNGSAVGGGAKLDAKYNENDQLAITRKKAKELVECLACILQKYLVNQDVILIYYFFGAFYAFFTTMIKYTK